MTEVVFGNSDSHATIFYDRSVRVCVVVANSLEHLTGAIATASMMNVDKILVVAPKVPTDYIPMLRESQELFVYEYGK